MNLRNIFNAMTRKIKIDRDTGVSRNLENAANLEELQGKLTSGEFDVYQIIVERRKANGEIDREIGATSIDYRRVKAEFDIMAKKLNDRCDQNDRRYAWQSCESDLIEAYRIEEDGGETTTHRFEIIACPLK